MVNSNVVEEQDLVEELRAEVNLLTYPFFALTTKDVTKRQETEFKATMKRDGKKLEVIWNVSAHQKYGYPGPFGKKVHKAIEQIIEEQQFPVENPITFSIYGLCKKMYIEPGGRQYNQIRAALKRIQFTSIESEGTFYLKGRKKWINKTFSLYDSIVFKGEELKTGEVAERTNLYLNDLYLESINSRYVKPINYSYYRSLSTNIAQRLYELLGVKFYGIKGIEQPYIRYKYSTLCQLLPLKRMQYLSSAKRRLGKAHSELKESAFLKDIYWSEVDGEKDWYLFYYPGQRANDEIEEYKIQEKSNNSADWLDSHITNKSEDEIDDLVSDMVGVLGKKEENENFYYRIARRCPRNVIETALSDTKTEERSGGIEKSKPAFFGYWIQELCDDRDINLGLDPSTEAKVVGGKKGAKKAENKGNEEPEASPRSDSSDPKEKEQRVTQEQTSQETEREGDSPELGYGTEEETEDGEEEAARKTQLIKYYRSLPEEKQEEIDRRAMDNLDSFTKGYAKKLERAGKDPLEDSISVKASFEDNRLKILEREIEND